MRKKYPSDITREQFERIEPVFEQAREQTKPRTVDIYEVFCGVLYVLKSGCQWRRLPDDFPTWATCYAYWYKWATARAGDHSLLEVVLKNVVGEVRHDLGRHQRTTFLIIDAQSVRNTDTAEQKGYDGGKLVSNGISVWIPMGCPTRSMSPPPTF
jgi:transposase